MVSGPYRCKVICSDQTPPDPGLSIIFDDPTGNEALCIKFSSTDERERYRSEVPRGFNQMSRVLAITENTWDGTLPAPEGALGIGYDPNFSFPTFDFRPYLGDCTCL